MIDILTIIASIEADKKARNISPSYALHSEIMNAVSKQVMVELNQGVSDGKLNFHRTINSYGFETIT